MTDPDTIVILGSARSDGNTKEALQFVLGNSPIEVVDLNTLNISHFDYGHSNKEDDFLPLMEKIVKKKNIILATPVYWYTMSAQMKMFMDRFSDLLIIRKDLGRALRGKNLYVITSYASVLPEHFEVPFRLTCEYMDMHYRTCYYHYAGNDSKIKEKNRGNADTFLRHFL